MAGKNFKYAISTLSCASASIFTPQNIIVPHLATRATIRRLAAMRSALKYVIPEDDCTASLHVGYMLDTPLALEEMKKNDIAISSVDTPDIRSLPAFIVELCKNTVIQTSLRHIKTTVGWQFASVLNKERYTKKVLEGIDAIHTNQNVHLVRASTGSWRKTDTGHELLALVARKRKDNPMLGIALEIDARHQTPEEYFDFVYKLNKNKFGVPVYFDLDVGHLAEARKRHRHEKIEKSEFVVEKLLNNQKYSKLVGMISLNQYDHTKDETHISLLKGSIDYIAIMKMLGEAGRAGNLSFDPIIMAEFSPFAYDEMISIDGLRYINSLKRAYLAE